MARLEAAGTPSSRIVLGGFSQGGAVAMLAAYRSNKQFAGCVSLSGWLTLRDQLNVSATAAATPLFWGHGQFDDKVLFEHQAVGVDALQQQGVEVTATGYPVEHTAHPDELEALATFIDEKLFK